MKLHLPVSLFRALRRCYSFVAPAALAATTAVTLCSQSLQAAPTLDGEGVTQGTATVTVGTATTILQETEKAVINWTDFSIAAGESVTFTQLAGDSSITLNRVTGDSPSSILGAMSANGNIFLINPNGIVFGAGSTVDAAGLMATTLDISDNEFMDSTGTYNFAGTSLAAIVNNGKITAKDDGFIYLVAARVENGEKGELVVGQRGTVGMGAGTQATIDFTGTGLISFTVSGEIAEKLEDDSDPGVENKGKVQANGGQVIMTADVKRTIVTSVIKNSGSIEANSMDDLLGTSGTSGSVTIRGTGGAVTNTGSITSNSSTKAAGSVEITADSVDNSGLISAAATEDGALEQGRVVITATEGAIIGTGNSSNIIANVAVLTATSTDGGAIGVATIVEYDDTSYVYMTPLNTQVNSLEIVTSSVIQSNGTSSGNVSIANSGDGDLQVEIVTNSNDSTSAGYAGVVIENANGAIEGTILSYSAQLTAAGDISITDGIFSEFTATVTGTGDIYLSNDSGLLYVNGMSSAFEGELAFDDYYNQVHSEGVITLNQTGSVILNGTLVAGESVSITSTEGHIIASTIVVDGVDTDDLDMDSFLSLGLIESQSITLSAAGAVGGGTRIVMGDSSAAGAGLTVTSGTLTETDGEGNTVTTGGVELTAESDVKINKIVATGELGAVSVSSSIGDIIVQADADEVAITAAAGITLNSEIGSIYSSSQSGSSVLSAERVELYASGDIAFLADDGTLSALTVGADVEELYAISSSGSVLLEQGEASATTTSDLWLYVTAGNNLSVLQNGSGNLSLYIASAGGEVELVTAGQLALSDSNPILDEVGYAYTTSSVKLSASSLILDVGSFASTISTSVSGDGSSLNYQITSDSDIKVSNVGLIGVSLQAGDSSSINFTNSGDVALWAISGGSVSMFVMGSVTDGNGDEMNISAETLDIAYATGFGTSTDAIELDLVQSIGSTGTLYADVSFGGVYIDHQSTKEKGTLYIADIQSFGGVSINSAEDVQLGYIAAFGQSVSLSTEQDIYALASEDYSPLNLIEAKSLSINANAIFGDLYTDVTYLSKNLSHGNISISNSGFLYVDAELLETKAGQSVSITASGMAIFDNGGGTTTLAEGTSLSLFATEGNIVFLNTDDSLVLTAGAEFSAIALGTVSGSTGYNGNVILGNIYTSGGDITILADGHISITELNTSYQAADSSLYGSVSLTAGGFIIDNNGDSNNITANEVTIVANSMTDEELLSDYTFAMSSTADLATLLQAYIVSGTLCEMDETTYSALYSQAVSDYDDAVAEYNDKHSYANSLGTSVTVAFALLKAGSEAYLVAEWLTYAARQSAAVAQSIPMFGDGGAMAVAEAVSAKSLALKTVKEQLDIAYEVLEMYANDAENEAVLAESVMVTYESNMKTLETQYNLAKNKVYYMNELIADTGYEIDSAVQLENLAGMALANKNAVGTADLALGIVANAVNVTNIDTEAQTGEASIYLQSSGDLGLGSVEAQGENSVVEVTAAGDISLLGSVSAGAAIELTSTAGSINAVYGSSLSTSSVASIVDLLAKNDVSMEATTISTEEYARVVATTGSVSVGDITAQGTDYPEGEYVLSEPEVDSYIELQAGQNVVLNGTLDSEIYVAIDAQAGAITVGNDNSVLTDELILKAETGIGADDASLQTRVAKLAAETNTGGIFLYNNGALLVTNLSSPVTGAVSGAQANAGDINILADSITIEAPISTSDDVYLSATSGAIVGAEDADLLFHVAGDAVTMNAITGIGTDEVALRTDMASLTAHVTSDGNINIAEHDALHILDADTANGSISIVAGGTITADDVQSLSDADVNDITLQATTGDIVAGVINAGTAGDVSLTAQGRVLNDDDNSTLITADELTISAGSGIGVDGASNEVTSLNTAANTLMADTLAGSVHIREQDDLLVERITATDEVTVQSLSGSLSIMEIDTAPSENEDTNITLVAANAILNEREDALAALKADELSLKAGDSIGTEDKAMVVEAETLAAAALNGVYINDLSGDLSIDTVTPNLGLDPVTGVTSQDGEVIIETVGALTVAEAVAAGTSVELTAGTSVAVDARVSAVGDIDILAKNGAITSTDRILSTEGNITLTTLEDDESVDASISLDGPIEATLGSITLNSADDISTTDMGSITAGQDLNLSAGGSIETEGPVTVGGDIKYVAGKNIIITDDVIVTKSISFETLDGYIKSIAADISSDEGNITLTSNKASEATDAFISLDGKVEATKGDITINSADDISTTDMGTLDAGSDVSLTAAGSISTNATASAARDVLFLAGEDITVSADLDAGGSIRLETKDGSIESIGAAMRAERGDITILTVKLDDARDASIKLDGDISAEAGALYVVSADGITTTSECDIKTSTGVEMAAKGDILTQGSIQSDGLIDMEAYNGSITIQNTVSSTSTGIRLNTLEEDETEGAIDSSITIESSLDAGTGFVNIISMDGLTTTKDGDIIAGDQVFISADSDIVTDGTIKADVAVAIKSKDGSVQLNDEVQSETSMVQVLAEGDILVNTSIQAESLVTLDSNSGAVTGDMTMSEAHVITEELDAKSATGLTLKTDVDTIYGDISGDGDFLIEEKDAVQLAAVFVENGSITVTAGGSIDAQYLVIKTDADENDISLVSQQGDISLLGITAGQGTQSDLTLSAANGSITQVSGGWLLADNLTAEAGDSISLVNTTLQSADSISTQSGDITVVESDGIYLGQINAADGAGDLTLTVGGDINDLDLDDALSSQIINLTANKVIISSTGSIGNVDKLELDVDSLVATTDEDIYIVQSGDIVLEEIIAEGTVEITSTGGSINGDAGFDPNISAKHIVLNAETGIGNDSTLRVESDSLSAQTTTGDIDIESQGGMNINLISTGDGDVRLVSANGAILDKNGDAMNIVGNSADLQALSGIGTGNSLESSIASLNANTTTGGIHLNNSGVDLELQELYTASGDISIVQHTGNLTVSEDIVLPAGNDISLMTEKLLYQNADVVTGQGDITMVAGDAILFEKGVRVDTGDGTLTLAAYSLNGLPDIYSRYVRIYTEATAGKYYIDYLFDDQYRIYSIWLNSRIVGGLVSANSSYVNEPFIFRHEKHDMGYSLLYQFGDYNKCTIDTSAYKINEIMNIKGISTWVYGN